MENCLSGGVSCGMLCDSCVYDLDCKLCLILDGGREEQFEFLCYFHWGDGEISADHLSACTAGDIRVFDSVCVCQLLSGGVSAGKERDACRGDGYAGSVCGDGGGGCYCA